MYANKFIKQTGSYTAEWIIKMSLKKTQPHKQSVKHKNMKDNCKMTK